MRKRLITAVPQVGPRRDQHWFDLGSVATVEVTSETKDHPVESALLLSETRGGVPLSRELSLSVYFLITRYE